MSVLIYVLVGGLLGLLVTGLMRMNELPDALFNISLGVIGAFVAGWIFTPLFGIKSVEPSYFSVSAFLVSLAGAILMLTVVNILRWWVGHSSYSSSSSEKPFS